MLSLQWPIVLFTTLILYVLVLLTLPFNSIYATIFLFTLIGFWSRLPGVGIPHPAFILYNLDIIDVFCIIIAINLGGPTGFVFALFTNMWSRVCGIYPDWVGSTKDALFQAIICLILPFVYSTTNSLVACTLVFTIGRGVLFLTVGMLVPHRSFANQILTEIQSQASLLVINLFYISIFGNYFDRLLQKGVSFSWTLFFFATAIILLFYIAFYRDPNKKKKSSLLKKVVKAAVKNSNKHTPLTQNQGMDEMNFVREALK